jgi:16S rRNA (adenine1518-N6/adenine1519-N6)-dimethyltransferase
LEKIRPKKSLGQNFLIDKNIAAKTVNALDINPEDSVIEIGPGTGTLTELILSKSANLTAIELDLRAYNLLIEKFPVEKFPGFKLINDDIRNFSFSNEFTEFSKTRKFKVLGNIPYYITADILFQLFENCSYISQAVLTIQKEVAQRIVAKPSSKEYGILTVASELCSKAKILFHVPGSCFYPPPNVTSSVILFDFNKENFNISQFKSTMVIVKKAFNQRRKMLSNAIKDFIDNHSVTSDIDEQFVDSIRTKRAEELTSGDFQRLNDILRNNDAK